MDAAACVAKVEGPRVEQLREFAQAFGCAYQMLDDLRDNSLFSSKASDGIIAEVQEACRSLEQRAKGGTRAETNAAGLMTAFLWSVFASASVNHDRAEKTQSDS